MSTLYYHPRWGGKATKVAANRLAVLDTIRERAEAATPGPWFTIGLPWTNSDDADTWVKAGSPDPHISTFVCDCQGLITEPDDEPRPDDYRPRENANFIAHARTDIPALLAYIDALHTLLGNLADGIDEYWASLPDNQLHIDALENITGKRVKRDS